MFNTQCNLDMTEANQVSSENEKKRKEKNSKGFIYSLFKCAYVMHESIDIILPGLYVPDRFECLQHGMPIYMFYFLYTVCYRHSPILSSGLIVYSVVLLLIVLNVYSMACPFTCFTFCIPFVTDTLLYCLAG